MMEQTQIWQSPPPRLTFDSQEVHIWRASLTVSAMQLESLRRLLSADEQDRADRFHFEKDRKHFVAARGMLRLILSRYLDRAPEAIAFDYTRYGKPFLHPRHAGGLRFNLSHASAWALYAVSHAYDVGVDLEYINPQRDTQQILERFFSENEKQEFRRLPECLRVEAFFSGWVRKEAFVKGRGEGLSFPLEKFSVPLHPAQPAGWIRIDPDKKDGREWTIQDIPVDTAYRAAVAVAGSGVHFQYWDGGALLPAA